MPKNVLLVTKGLGRGGAERLLVNGTSYIDETRFHIEVAYLLPWKDAFVPELRAREVPVHLLECRHELDPRWLVALRRLVSEREIDVVHTHMPFVGVGARAVFLGSAPLLLHTEHNLWSRYRTPTRLANMLTIKRNRTVIAVSGAVAASMKFPSWLPLSLPPVEIVRHGADLAAVRSGPAARARARTRLDLADGDWVIGTVGNFTAKKDHSTLLRAVALLRGDEAELRVVLIGSGPLEEELRLEARALGIEDAVLFTGMRDDVNELLPAFDVFALSSRYEGLPIALLEAMASGVPPIATRVGGIPEVITDGVDGVLVEPGRPDQLAAAARRILDDRALAAGLGEAAMQRAAAFDLGAAVERTEAIYESLLASR